MLPEHSFGLALECLADSALYGSTEKGVVHVQEHVVVQAMINID
jgi:hypothetical protein